MNRETWALIKRNKNFNVHVFRRGVMVLIFALVLASVLEIIVGYLYLTLPNRDYYETNGVTPPMKLKPLLTPNYSSVPLLEDDQPMESLDREIPQ